MRCPRCQGCVDQEWEFESCTTNAFCINCGWRGQPEPTVRVERVEPGTCYICGTLPRHMDWEICYRCSAVSKAHERKRAQHVA